MKPPVPGMVVVARFDGDPDEEWMALGAVERWCRERDYSLGALQASDPVGIVALPGVLVGKWRHLMRSEVDGAVTWAPGPRHGGAVVWMKRRFAGERKEVSGATS